MSVDETPMLVGLFDDRDEAHLAVDELRQAGFTDDAIGFAIRKSDLVHPGMNTDGSDTTDVKEAVGGAAVGAVVGAGLATVVSLALPGVGPILASGVLAIALGYGAAGAAVGGIFGAMHGLGVSENEARDYEKEFNQGRAIVAVRAGERSGEAAYILQRHGAFNLKKESNCPVPTMGKGDS